MSFFAVFAANRERKGSQASFGDSVAALDTDAVGIFAEPPQRYVDLVRLFRLHLDQRELDVFLNVDLGASALAEHLTLLGDAGARVANPVRLRLASRGTHSRCSEVVRESPVLDAAACRGRSTEGRLPCTSATHSSGDTLCEDFDITPHYSFRSAASLETKTSKRSVDSRRNAARYAVDPLGWHSDDGMSQQLCSAFHISPPWLISPRRQAQRSERRGRWQLRDAPLSWCVGCHARQGQRAERETNLAQGNVQSRRYSDSRYSVSSRFWSEVSFSLK
jgi:hypothetical protein